MLFPIDQAPGDADRLAFQMCESGETVTFGQLEARANQVARVLRSCGVTRGRHVALLMKNHRRFLEACFGAGRADAATAAAAALRKSPASAPKPGGCR